jgi:hypothetical protein
VRLTAAVEARTQIVDRLLLGPSGRVLRSQVRRELLVPPGVP